MCGVRRAVRGVVPGGRTRMGVMAGSEGSGDQGESDGKAGGKKLPLERDSSLLYSLDKLKEVSIHTPPVDMKGPDSGSIDLTKLPRQASSAAPSVLDAMPAVGEIASEPERAAPPPVKKGGSTGIGIGIAVAGLAIAGAVVWVLRPTPPETSATAVSASVTAAPALPSASAQAIASGSASASASASAAPKGVTPTRGTKPKEKAAEPAEETPPAAEPSPTPTETAPPKPPPSPCGCAAEDLKCNMDCAVSGKKK